MLAESLCCVGQPRQGSRQIPLVRGEASVFVRHEILHRAPALESHEAKMFELVVLIMATHIMSCCYESARLKGMQGEKHRTATGRYRK